MQLITELSPALTEKGYYCH